MSSDSAKQALRSSIHTFAELLKNALLFDPVTQQSQYIKAQEFRVLPKGRFNAQVSEYELTHLLPGPRYDFNLGVWYALLDSVACTCADSQFFSEIESGVIKDYPSNIFAGSQRFQDYSCPTNSQTVIYPNFPSLSSPVRQELADQQLEIAVKFVSLHEQAHVFAGHLLYVCRNLGGVSLLEIDEEPAIEPIIKARRAIEIQADTIAFETLVHTSLSRVNKLRENEPRFFNITSDVDWLVACISATTVVCCLFEISDRSRVGNPRNRKHPSARCRLLSIFRFCISILIQIVNTDNELHSAIRRILLNTSVIFNTLEVEPLEHEAFQWLWKPSSSVINSESVKELLELEEELNLLEPDLKQLQAEVLKRLLPSNGANLNDKNAKF